MKKIVLEETKGFESLLGEKVILFCANYFYTGTLEGVNEIYVLLRDPSIVYETGPWSEKGWKDSQKLHCEKLYVQLGFVESFGKSK